jgi:hypothetical protein
MRKPRQGHRIDGGCECDRVAAGLLGGHRAAAQPSDAWFLRCAAPTVRRDEPDVALLGAAFNLSISDTQNYINGP